MRKLLLLSLMAIAIQSQAQNVGIGTPTPGAKLEVLGTGNTSATNTFLLKNSLAKSLLRMQDNGQLFVGEPSVADIRQYKFRVESGDKGSLFIENPVTIGNATVRILRGVPEANSYFTTALSVEAADDRSASFKGRGGIYAVSNFPNLAAGEFIAAESGLALKSHGKVEHTGIGEASGRVLVSDAIGNATWQNSTKYTSIIPPSCQNLAIATSTFAKIADLGTFTKDNLETKIELMLQTNLQYQSIIGGSVVRYELRVDNLPTSNGIARASIDVAGQQFPASIFGLFTNISIGMHTVSLWANTSLTASATNVIYDPGCESSTSLTVKETY